VTAVPTYELPVAWWLFWIVALGILAFGGLCWWLLRTALHEDHAAASHAPAPEPPDGGAGGAPRSP